MKAVDRKNIMPLTLILVVGVALRVLAVIVVGSSRLPWELEFQPIFALGEQPAGRSQLKWNTPFTFWSVAYDGIFQERSLAEDTR